MNDALPEVTGSDLFDTIVALGIVVTGIVIAWLVAVVLPRVLRRLLPTDAASPVDAVIDSVRRPAFWLIIAQGLFLALRHPGYMAPHTELIDRLWVGVVVLAVLIGIIRAANEWFSWYQERSEQQRAPGRIEPRVLNLMRRSTNAVLIVIGTLLLLDVLGLEITPLIAGLGIGGLAVGLALQPVLSSVFASSSMISDSSLRVGDLVEIIDGPVGTVEHIGWRATRIRSFDNNIVLIPNAKLAESTFTNYSSSSYQADARVIFGVAYEEDLERVEEVLRDELMQLRSEFPAAVQTYDPLVLFQGFGDSNIDVLIKLRAATWLDSFTLRHLMVKRVHARLTGEDITINYPARRLLLQQGDVDGFEELFGRAEDARRPVRMRAGERDRE